MSRPKDYSPTFEDIPPAVQWHEGMLLAPQHFQQQALRQETLLSYHLRQGLPFHWGLNRLEYDEDRLRHEGLLRVTALEAILPDGLAVSFNPAEGVPLELKLTTEHLEALEKGPQRIHLAVLAEKRGGAGLDGRSSRYRETQSEPLYDASSRDVPMEIQQLVPWLRLGFGEPRPSDCSLPLLELRQRVAGAPFEVSDYLGPQLGVSTGSVLYNLCGDVSERVQLKVGHLRNSLDNLTSRQDQDDASRPEANRRQLYQLIAGLPAFEAVWRTGLCHPFSVYVALCSLAGHVAAVIDNPLPPRFRGYQHDEPLACFGEVAGFIWMRLEEGIPESFEVWPLKACDKGFELDISEPNEVLDRRLVLGVVGSSQTSLDELREWGLGCSIGTPSGMAAMRDKRTPGVRREHLTSCPELAPWGRMLLFELKPDRREDPDLYREKTRLRLRVEYILQGKPHEPHPVQVVLFSRKPPPPQGPKS